MKNFIKIDLANTKRNINDRLCELTYKNKLAEYLGVGERDVQRMLNVEDDREIKHAEYENIASFLRCEVDDLIVHEGETFVKLEFVVDKVEPEMKKIEDVELYANNSRKLEREKKFRNLREFLLYVPLMEPYDLAGFIEKTIGNLERKWEYIMDKADDLYTYIESDSAKKYADNYRNQVLRTKGAPDAKEYAITDEWDYEGKKKYEEKAEEFIAKLRSLDIFSPAERDINKYQFAVKQEVLLEKGAGILGEIFRFEKENGCIELNHVTSKLYSRVWRAKRDILVANTGEELNRIDGQFDLAVGLLSDLESTRTC